MSVSGVEADTVDVGILVQPCRDALGELTWTGILQSGCVEIGQTEGARELNEGWI